MKFKKGDILTDRYNTDDICWSIWKVIHTYSDDLGSYYWVKNLYYETSDNSSPQYMDIHDEGYMELLCMRKLTKGEYSEIMAKVL